MDSKTALFLVARLAAAQTPPIPSPAPAALPVANSTGANETSVEEVDVGSAKYIYWGNPDNFSKHVGAVVGCGVGGLVILMAAAFLFYFYLPRWARLQWLKYRRKMDEEAGVVGENEDEAERKRKEEAEKKKKEEDEKKKREKGKGKEAGGSRPEGKGDGEGGEARQGSGNNEGGAEGAEESQKIVYQEGG